MFIGHAAVALTAKPLAPRASLGVLIAAAFWLDLVWPVLVLAGIERVEIAPGDTAFTPLRFVHYPWSHSLAAALAWGVFIALACWRLAGGVRGAVVLGALVFSHWPLDALGWSTRRRKKQRPKLVGALPLSAVLRRFYIICAAALFSARDEPRRSGFDLTVAVVQGIGM